MLDENKKYPIDFIIAWLVSVKNALHTCYGYSPNQLVFRNNPNFTSNLTKKPPAMEDITHSQLLFKHLNAMHASRKEDTNLVEKEENFEQADSNKSQPEENGNVEGKISDDDIDSDFSSTKISRVTEDSAISRNNGDIEDITSSLNDLSIQSPGILDIRSLVQSSDKPDNPTVFLPTVKSNIVYHNSDLKSWNETLVLERAGKSSSKRGLI